MLRRESFVGRFLAVFIIFSLFGPAFSQTSGQVSYTYDELGRLTSVTYSNGAVAQYSYDAAGNRTTVSIQPSGVGDSVPTIGLGPNLIDLSGWPVGDAPAGPASVSGWPANATYSNEARWVQVTGPGQIGTITAMEAGQTEPDENGGGARTVNWFDIDPTKAYEYTIYFRKHDLSLQNLYFGPHRQVASGSGIEHLSLANGSGAPSSNPYILAWNLSSQAANLDASKWYKVVGYVLPEGHPLVSNADWGGIYDVDTGAKVANVQAFRWNPDRPDDRGVARFYTFYSEASQGVYTTYFYQPEVRVTNVSYTPVVPAISTSHVNAAEGNDITFTVNLSQATTVPVRVDYVVDHDGAADSAEAGDYTAVSGTLTIADGESSGVITVTTIVDSILEGNEAVRLTLSNPVSATITAGQEVEKAFILDGGGECDGTAELPCFIVDDVSALEGDDIVFTITKYGTTAISHDVSYATANGTALGSDYTAIPLTAVTFGSTDTIKTFTVTTTEDTTIENDETFFVNLSGATNGAVISDPQGIGTITNDDATAPAFSIDDVTATEGGNLVFTVTKTGSTSQTHAVSFATANGSAVSGSDYVANSGSLSFTSAQTSKTITIVGAGDAIFELQETFNVNLSAPTNSATISDGTGVGTINDNDPAPAFSIDDVTATEGGNLVFTVTKTNASSFTHQVSFATANGSAVSGSDYVANSGSVSFTSAQTSKTITIVGAGDAIFELQETFNVNLSAPTNSATISDGTGVGTINDNDTAPSFAINNVTATEGGNLVFTVTKSGSTSLTHAVSFATANGSAVSGSDYVANSGNVSFTSAETSKTITITGAGDSIFELQETFTVELSAPTNSATISDGTGVATINDNDTAPSFAIFDVTATEGGNIVFTVNKTGSTAVTHAVSFTTANGSALAGSDYVANSGNLSFTSAEVQKTITITGTGDSIFELQETFNVNLSAPTNSATISDGTGVGTINDNDPAPAFSIDDVTAAEGGNLVFTVTKTNASSFTHQVSYATTNGSAVAGSDYVTNSGSVSFTSAETSKTITIVGAGDAIFELQETFNVNLSAPTNSATISDGTGVGTINDNDPAPAFSIDDVTATEGGNLVFTVTKTNATSFTHQVSYGASNGTAIAGSDYDAVIGTLSFNSVETSKTITVSTIEDSISEPQENMTINLSAPTNSATISDATGVGTIDDDDFNNPPVAVNDSYTVNQLDVVQLQVLNNDSDPDGNSLTITNVTNPSKGSVVISCSATCVVYTSPSQGGNTSFVYTISDGFGGTDTATVSITISGGGPPRGPELPPEEGSEGGGS